MHGSGTVQMMWRTTKTPTALCPGHSCQAWAHAPGWRGPYTWNVSNIFYGQPDAMGTHIEDAHMWASSNSSHHPGSYHAIFHSDVERNAGGVSLPRLCHDSARVSPQGAAGCLRACDIISSVVSSAV